MTEIGYHLSSEEHGPKDLVRYARRAEESGFTFATISDHYHPWTDRQGQSPFVWSVIGGIAQVTVRLQIGTAVTCPTMRMQPAIVAQAAATAAAMLPGRFFLGVGTGENLNEHITGEHWPPIPVRREMVEEAVEVIRLLWQGETESYYGNFFTIQDARIYTLPDELPPIFVAASGPVAAEMAGRIGDGFISVAGDSKVVDAFEMAGGAGKPRYCQLNVCWDEDEAAARKTAHEWFPIVGITGELTNELPLPRHFEQAAAMISEEDVASQVACGPDPETHIEAIRKALDAGYDHVFVHQCGPNQEGFFRFYEREVLPEFRSQAVMDRAAA